MNILPRRLAWLLAALIFGLLQLILAGLLAWLQGGDPAPSFGLLNSVILFFCSANVASHTLDVMMEKNLKKESMGYIYAHFVFPTLVLVLIAFVYVHQQIGAGGSKRLAVLVLALLFATAVYMLGSKLQLDSVRGGMEG